MPRKKKSVAARDVRRRYTDEFKEEAVQMLLDGHTAPSLKERPGLPSVNMLYRWKQEQLARSGPVASSLEARVRELESELRRVERERDTTKPRAIASRKLYNQHHRAMSVPNTIGSGLLQSSHGASDAGTRHVQDARTYRP